MQRRIFVYGIIVLCLTVSTALAADMLSGTWKQNMAKSKYDPANLAPKSGTTKWEAIGADGLKWVADGVDAQGKPTHAEFSGKFDGKDYPLTGDPTADTRSYKQIDPRTLELTNKKGGKVVVSGKITVSADGKTRTVSTKGMDTNGKKLATTAVYNKQ